MKRLLCITMFLALFPAVAQARHLPGPTPVGPGGGVFSVHCDYSHRAQDDPIVNPGQPGGAAHIHEFFGSKVVDDTVTRKEMREGGTTCELSADTAGYWTPALRAPSGALVAPDKTSAYYRAPQGTPVRAIPKGLVMIAGYSAGQAGSVQDVFGWSCNESRPYYPTPRKCSEKNVLHVAFPSCWDGVHLDSPDHRSHMAYGGANCPASHPVAVAKLSMHVQYHGLRDGTGYVLDTGALPHADFFQAWEMPVFKDLVRTCLNANKSCLRRTD